MIPQDSSEHAMNVNFYNLDIQSLITASVGDTGGQNHREKHSEDGGRKVGGEGVAVGARG